MFDHLLESSQWDDSNKWSKIGFYEEVGILEINIRTLSGTLDHDTILNIKMVKFIKEILAMKGFKNKRPKMGLYYSTDIHWSHEQDYVLLSTGMKTV